ncbi:g6272 [Coccomyxa elongata]
MFDLKDFLSPAESAPIKCKIPSFPDHLQHCLITGPVRCGKTSILLHYAYKLALKGKRVLFICQKAKIEQVPPLLPPGVDGNNGAFSNVHMRYLSTAADLQKIAACLHLLDELPEAIIVDDLSSFIDARGPEHGAGDKRQRDAELVRTLAFLHEATAYASKKLAGIPCVSRNPACSCHLLVTDPVTDGPQNLQLMQRWLPLHLTIRGSGPDFTLSVVPQVLKANNLPMICAAQLCYQLAPFSAITLMDVKPPVVEVDTATTVM